MTTQTSTRHLSRLSDPDLASLVTKWETDERSVAAADVEVREDGMPWQTLDGTDPFWDRDETDAMREFYYA